MTWRLVATALTIVGLGAWSTGAADAATTQRPAIEVLTAAPNVVSAEGGTVVVHVRVAHAARCAFRGQRAAFASLTLRRTVDCHSGRASVRMPIAANRYQSGVTLHFAVTATDAHGRTARSTITVAQSPKQAPATVVALAVTTHAVPNGALGQPYSATLTAVGGSGSYSWSVASGSLPPGIALSSAGELAGTPTAGGQYTFTAQAADSAGKTAVSALAVTVSDSHVGAAPSAPTVNSSNWSGYALGGGPFTSVAGTFNVPAISPSSGDSSIGEWVGIDGWGAGASSIIQAGIGEDYLAATNVTRVYAWYELYPAPAYALPLDVSIGDTITVSIAQVSGGLWDVRVKDETTGQSTTDEFSYGGVATTAEWIVEAPYSTITQSVTTLAPFSPVRFANLTALPAGQPPTRFVMYQQGQPVSTPSLLSDNGFTVGYGGVTPDAP